MCLAGAEPFQLVAAVRGGGESEENLRLMHRIDELYTACPFYGSHKLTMVLRREGHGVNRKRVRRLMRRVGLESIVLKPQLSRPRRGFARADDRTHQSGLVKRHHLPAHRAGVCRPSGGHRLAQSLRVGLER